MQIERELPPRISKQITLNRNAGKCPAIAWALAKEQKILKDESVGDLMRHFENTADCIESLWTQVQERKNGRIRT